MLMVLKYKIHCYRGDSLFSLVTFGLMLQLYTNGFCSFLRKVTGV